MDYNSLYFACVCIICQDQRQENFVPVPSDLPSELRVSFSPLNTLIPLTYGISFRPNNEPCLIVVFSTDSTEPSQSKQESQANSIMTEIRKNHVGLCFRLLEEFTFPPKKLESDCFLISYLFF